MGWQYVEEEKPSTAASCLQVSCIVPVLFFGFFVSVGLFGAYSMGKESGEDTGYVKGSTAVTAAIARGRKEKAKPVPEELAVEKTVEATSTEEKVPEADAMDVIYGQQ